MKCYRIKRLVRYSRAILISYECYDIDMMKTCRKKQRGSAILASAWTTFALTIYSTDRCRTPVPSRCRNPSGTTQSCSKTMWTSGLVVLWTHAKYRRSVPRRRNVYCSDWLISGSSVSIFSTHSCWRTGYSPMASQYWRPSRRFFTKLNRLTHKCPLDPSCKYDKMFT